MELWAALSLGFLGSFHCIGMCGPIALGLNMPGASLSTQMSHAFLYNFGRLCSYSVLGLLFGLAGTGIHLAGYQELLSISIGVTMLIYLLIPNIRSTNPTNSLYSQFLSYISRSISDLYRKKTRISRFFIGVLNGFLPCGFVLVAITTSMITSSPLHSMWFMLFFALGTFPTMLSLNLTPSFFKPTLRTKIRGYSNYFAFAIALFLIYRGAMNIVPHHNMGAPALMESVCEFPLEESK